MRIEEYGFEVNTWGEWGQHMAQFGISANVCERGEGWGGC